MSDLENQVEDLEVGEEEQLDEDEVEESVRAMTSANKEHFKNMPEKTSKLRESLKERFARLIK